MRIAEASENIALGDIIYNQIRKDNQWNLLKDYGNISSINPSILCSGILNYPSFPSYFYKISTNKKNKRLTKELE